MSDSELESKFGSRSVDFPSGRPPTPRTDRPTTWTVTDARDRKIRLSTLDYASADDVPGLVEMYDGFDRDGRAQGLPPADRDSVREWLTALGDGVHLLASHGGRPVGHATLVPDGEGAHELAIFVDGANRHARIGTHLLDTLLTHARGVGVDAVWLLVERHNRPAVALYANAGFETADAWGGTMKMRLELDGPDDPPTGD